MNKFDQVAVFRNLATGFVVSASSSRDITYAAAEFIHDPYGLRLGSKIINRFNQKAYVTLSAIGQANQDIQLIMRAKINGVDDRGSFIASTLNNVASRTLSGTDGFFLDPGDELIVVIENESFVSVRYYYEFLFIFWLLE